MIKAFCTWLRSESHPLWWLAWHRYFSSCQYTCWRQSSIGLVNCIVPKEQYSPSRWNSIIRGEGGSKTFYYFLTYHKIHSHQKIVLRWRRLTQMCVPESPQSTHGKTGRIRPRRTGARLRVLVWKFAFLLRKTARVEQCASQGYGTTADCDGSGNTFRFSLKLTILRSLASSSLEKWRRQRQVCEKKLEPETKPFYWRIRFSVVYCLINLDKND